MPDETVIFCHVPRTAGTTINRIIERQYGPQEDYWIGRDSPDDQELRAMSPARRAQIRMLRGHVPFGLHECFPGTCAYFTLLREPIERVISFYFFVRREPEHYAHEALLAKDMTLQRYVESWQTPVTSNFATRMLSGTWAGTPGEPCDKGTLALAKHNLDEQFAVVGLTERFDETLLLLKRRFGWRTAYYRQHNVTRSRPSQETLSAETLAVLREHNRLDLVLYDHAKALFEKQVAAAGPDFAHKVRRFQRVNRLAQPFIWGYETAREVSVRSWLRKLSGRDE